MLRGMAAGRLIAAADMPADAADAQVKPRASGLETLFAAIGFRIDMLKIAKMRAAGGHDLNSFRRAR
jgi:hypothetical protein